VSPTSPGPYQRRRQRVIVLVYKKGDVTPILSNNHFSFHFHSSLYITTLAPTQPVIGFQKREGSHLPYRVHVAFYLLLDMSILLFSFPMSFYLLDPLTSCYYILSFSPLVYLTFLVLPRKLALDLKFGLSLISHRLWLRGHPSSELSSSIQSCCTSRCGSHHSERGQCYVRIAIGRRP
jgi:hypothetical protein